jgi:hypothetical protein
MSALIFSRLAPRWWHGWRARDRAVVLLGGALAAMIWCSVSLTRANPHHRLPGKLPDVVHPPAFMWVGMLGIVIALCGGAAAAGSAGLAMVLIAGAVLFVGLLPPQLLHNRRLRR